MFDKRGVSESVRGVLKTIIILVLIIVIGYFIIRIILKVWDVIF